MCRPSRMFWIVLILGLWTSNAAVRAQPATVPPDHAERMKEGLELFKSQVRPVLFEQCLECHGGKSIKGRFDLSTREALLKSGRIAAKAKESVLYRVIAHLEEPYMPHKKPKLPDAAIAYIARWIELGAPYDRPLTDRPLDKTAKLTVSEADRQHWAFRPLKREAPPAVKQADWVRTPIDRFLRATMEAKGIAPAPDADRRRLLRRLYFDLIGLPPEPDAVEAFVREADFEKAWESQVDKLLASQQFGERWARHWLDPARFAESHGFEHDYDRPFAYHYRDFVIRAFNQDLPFDQFLRWQLAGDELAPGNAEALAATGFLGAGVFPTQITTREAERVRYDAMDDMLATTGHAMLALTIGCARCHDHKYDPIPARDYYQMLSTFTTTVRSEVDVKMDGAKGNGAKIQICSEGVKPMRRHVADNSIPDFYLQTYFLQRGDTAQKDGVAAAGFLQVLMRHPEGTKHWDVPKPAGSHTSFRRAALANWLTDVNEGAGALAARVIVNRLWHHHMGRGIVTTVNDFGNLGDRPSHPELLDWLAADLVESGWRLKHLHKMIVMSRAYRLSGTADLADLKADPDNRWCARRPRRRLEAEIIRDNLLAVGGMLDPTMYGPGTLDESMKRRSIYFKIKRSQLIPMLQVLDWPDTLTSAAARPSTIVAPQALLFLNHPQVRKSAEGLAKRLKTEATPAAIVDRAYRIAFARPPSAKESSVSVAFLGRQGAVAVSEQTLVDFAQALIGLNEFLYVD
jgi:mono/diheme cytochrome c family protein